MPTPTHSHLHQVAQELKRRLKDSGEAWITIDRWEATELLREISGERSTRIKSTLGECLDLALLAQGVRCFPTFQATSTYDSIRLFRPETTVASLIDILTMPDESTDQRLARYRDQIRVGRLAIRAAKKIAVR